MCPIHSKDATRKESTALKRYSLILQVHPICSAIDQKKIQNSDHWDQDTFDKLRPGSNAPEGAQGPPGGFRLALQCTRAAQACCLALILSWIIKQKQGVAFWSPLPFLSLSGASGRIHRQAQNKSVRQAQNLSLIHISEPTRPY